MEDFLRIFYEVFQEQYETDAAPTPIKVFAPLQDVVFDHKGDYYAAVPLDFREEDYKRWLETDEGQASGQRDTPILETSRYITNVFVALEGRGFVALIDKPSDLDNEEIRRKFKEQGSPFHVAKAFRLYKFRKGAWADIVMRSVVSADAEERARYERGDREPEKFRTALEREQERRALQNLRSPRDLSGRGVNALPEPKRIPTTERKALTSAVQRQTEEPQDADFSRHDDPDTDTYSAPNIKPRGAQDRKDDDA
jgi:hypothetical protein